MSPPLWKRRWFRVVAAILALLLVLVLAKNFFVRKGLEAAVTEVTGFPLAIDSFDLGVLDAKVDVRGLHLRNPGGFEDPRCLDVRRLAADVELSTAFGGEFHAEAIDLDIDEVVVVRNAKGETNLDRLAALGSGGGKEEGKPPEKEAPAKEVKWRCDRLHLRIPRVVFLDYTAMRGDKPKREVYDLKVDENFRDLHEPGAIVRLIVLKVIAGTPIRLVNATVEGLTRGLGSVVEGVGGVVKGIGEGVGDALGGILGGSGEKDRPPPKKPDRKKK